MKRKTLSENVLHNTLAVIGILQEGGSSQLAVVLQLPLKTSCCLQQSFLPLFTVSDSDS